MTEMQAEHLAQAMRHVAEGEQRIADQKALIGRLTQDAHDTTKAKAFLVTLEKVLATMQAHLQLILREIASEAV